MNNVVEVVGVIDNNLIPYRDHYRILLHTQLLCIRNYYPGDILIKAKHLPMTFTATWYWVRNRCPLIITDFFTIESLVIMVTLHHISLLYRC